MPVEITIRNLGDPPKEAHLRMRLEALFKKYAANWTVKVLGSEGDAIWELIVTGPDGRAGQWVYKKFYGNERNIETILQQVRRIAEQARKETKGIT